ncbi:hypothetical protein B296_00016281 [Ensete ventricosum]|uniref:Uncharacterized protein n=1 Tax=Ensete ventricosum TaxID=4639 RepID=A0A426ZKY2_ENSVE|nr:hypothetical protein B296_00016281 [Ensete ventricosum]
MTDPGFPPPASNPAPFVVTAEAFLGLTNQVQALTSMVQTIVPYLPQLIQSVTPQLAPPTIFPQMESPMAPNRETQLKTEVLQRRAPEVYSGSPTTTPARSRSRSCDLVQVNPNLDSLSSDSVDSLREQVRQVHQRLDEVQKEVLKLKGEVGECSKGSSRSPPRYRINPYRPTSDSQSSNSMTVVVTRQNTS